MRYYTRKERGSQSGFTLIEVLVSLALFAVVMTVAVGTLLILINANKKTQSLKTGINNLFFATETMSRLIRTGYTYHCGATGTLTDPRDCATGDTYIQFVDDTGRDVAFYLGVSGGRGSVYQEIDGGTPFPVTAEDVDIQTLLFHVTGSTPGDAVQPMVTLTLEGIVSTGVQVSSTVRLQTSLTQRILDE